MFGSNDMTVAVGDGVRRLPIYLLIDCSSSMRGAPIAAVQQGLEQFAREIGADAFASQTAHIGIITFDDDARMVTPGLVPAELFQVGQLHANGHTALGAALRVLQQSLDYDVRPARSGRERGDWKPLVFILTDGDPTDDWQTPRQELLGRQSARVLNIVTVGCGPGINTKKLAEIGLGQTFHMDDSHASFRQFFAWVTQSVVQASHHVSVPQGGDRTTALPANPKVMQYIP